MEVHRIQPNQALLQYGGAAIILNCPNNATQVLMQQKVYTCILVITHLAQENLEGIAMFVCQTTMLKSVVIKIYGPIGVGDIIRGMEPAVQRTVLDQLVITEFNDELQLHGVTIKIAPNSVALHVDSRKEIDKTRICREFEFSLERSSLIKGRDVLINGQMRRAADYFMQVAEQNRLIPVVNGLLQLE